MHLTRNQAYLYGYRGFESLPLRHLPQNLPETCKCSSGCHPSGGLHFVPFSCYRSQQIPELPASREVFEHSLEIMRLRYEFFVSGNAVMPEHVHLLVSASKKGPLAKALQALKLSVAVQRSECP